MGAKRNIDLVAISHVERKGQNWTEYRNLYSTNARRSLVVHRHWSRDPEGPVMHRTKGKTIDNGTSSWGASLEDFYYTRPFPSSPDVWTISTSSKLLEFCDKIGEQRYAAPHISQARDEEGPKEILPFSVAKIIRDLDSNDMGFDEVRALQPDTYISA